MTTTLPRNFPAVFLEDARYLAPAHDRQLRHQTLTSTCWTSTVSGMPRSARTSRQSVMASLTFFSASSRVLPWLTQPGIERHSATHTPSSSRSRTVANFIRWTLAASAVPVNVWIVRGARLELAQSGQHLL